MSWVDVRAVRDARHGGSPRDLPWEIDLVRLSALEDAEVRAHIARVGVAIYRASGEESGGRGVG